jgi:PAS domain S-box-containing protein
VKRHVFRDPLWILTIVMFFSLIYPSRSQADRNHTNQRHVLLLHSYHKGMTWVDDITNSVTATLWKTDPDIEFHVEYMDTKRVLGEEHLGNLYKEYRFKFKKERFDAVVIADDGALRFVLKYYDDLFPGTPVIFCGINNLEAGMLDNRPEFTGILEYVDVADTLKVALALHPNSRHVYIINDMSASGKGLHKEIAKAITAYAARADFTFLEDYTAAELAAIIAKLPSNSIILRSAFWVDKSGRSLPNEKISFAAVGSGAVVPVYSLWDFYMGLGIVGGKMISGTAQGELAAQLAARILNGEKPSTIPVVVKSPNRLMFDYKQMHRFGIARSSLPPGSEVINEPLPFYAINKALTWTGAIFTLAMTFITVLLVLNVNRRKRTEENLRESKERLKIIFETSQAGILMGDVNGKLVFCNSRLAEMLACTPEELTGACYSDYLHEAGKSDDDDDGLRLLLAGEIDHVSAETLFVRKNGTCFWGYLSARRLDGNDGDQMGVVGVIADISELKQATDALVAEKELLAVTLSSIGDGVITVDTDGRVVMLNGVAEHLCGWSHAEAVGKPLTQVFPIINEKTGATQENPVDKVLESGGVVELANNTILLARDGARRVIADSAAPMRNQDGNIIGVVLVFRDMTEKRNIEEELFKARKLDSLGVLAGGIAHDFNNLLTGITGNISLAMMLLPSGEKTYAFLDNAEKASARARELTQQLLTFARGGAPVKKVVSLRNLVSESVSLVLHGSNVMGIVDIPDSIHAIEADEGQMSQVLHNIIINAAQAMPGGGILTVTSQNENLYNANTMALPDGSYVRISFTDQGYGISDDDLKRIFDPYFTTKSSGNGLGLASVHSIVSRHGGHIGASSVEGKGTTFTIHLPSIGETYIKYQEDSVKQTAGDHKGGSILVMDDEKMIRDMATEMLEYLGYQVTTCENGAEAIVQYKAASESGVPFSVVIMDLTIPGGMGGKEAAEQILAIDPQACLVVSSGYSNDPIMSAYSNYGFNGAMTKPYNIMELGQLLSSLLSK